MTEPHTGPDEGTAKSSGSPAVGSRTNGDRRMLEEAIDDASLLVWFACKKGVSNIEKSTIEVLTNAKALFDSERWTASEEAEFGITTVRSPRP